MGEYLKLYREMSDLKITDDQNSPKHFIFEGAV